MSESASPEPVLQVVRGGPVDAATLAALVVVVTAAARARPPAAPAPERSGWTADPPWRLVLPPPGPGAWQAAVRPPWPRTGVLG